MIDVVQLVRETIGGRDPKRFQLLDVLQELVKKERFLTEAMMVEVSKQMNIPVSEVYGTATFYSFLDVVPRGKKIVRICRTISCDMKKKEAILEAIEGKLQIKLGETTADKRFSLLETNCLGHCHKGPVMLIDDQVYADLTPEKAVAAIEEHLQ